MDGINDAATKAKAVYGGSLLFSAALTAVSHPLTYVKVLMQVGHEPLPPEPVTTFFFRKKVMRFPNFIQYAGHIRKVDGWFGLYRGLGPRIVHNVVSTVVTNSVTNKVFDKQRNSNTDEDEKTVHTFLKEILREILKFNMDRNKQIMYFLLEIDWNDPLSANPTKWLNILSPTNCLSVFNHFMELALKGIRWKATGNLLIARTAGIVVSYPFHMISIRMMVQFVGRETHYRNIFTSIHEIYQEEGILGFFSGLIPHLIGELFAIWMCKTLNFVVEKYFLTQDLLQMPEIRSYTQGISQYIASTATYPFQLVTNIMAVNDTRLAAGNPPLMPIYGSWTDCWRELGRKGLRSRGASLFQRNLRT